MMVELRERDSGSDDERVEDPPDGTSGVVGTRGRRFYLHDCNLSPVVMAVGANRFRTKGSVSVAVSEETVSDCEAIAGIWNGGGRHSDTGCGHPEDGLVVLLEKTRAGTLPQSFFESREMRSYSGSMNDRRGRAFTQRVAERLRNIGWRTRTEVGMRELGGSGEDGDVDVLAWSDAGEIQVIECKCLYLARTVTEVAEICGRFRGEAKDGSSAESVGQSVGLVAPRQTPIVRVCSPASRRVAPLRPRGAGLTAWTPAPRTLVRLLSDEDQFPRPASEGDDPVPKDRT